MNERFIKYYMDIARRTAQMSYAKRLKVGAILVKNDMIISHSWNGTPRGWDNNCEDIIYENEIEILKTKSCVTHAEEAMLMKVASSDISSYNGIVFCTHSCCMNCAKLLYGAKITSFYYENEYKSNEGIKFLNDCGINIYKIGE